MRDSAYYKKQKMKMDGLKIPEMSSCSVDQFVNKKREMTSSESSSTSTPLGRKKTNVDDDESEASLGPSPSEEEEENSSRRDVNPPVGILMASGERTEEEEGDMSVKSVSHGLISVIGRRRSMEDAVAVAVDGEVESYNFFAVYDGHGGSCAANMCRDRLHLIVAEEVEERRKTLLLRGGGGERGLEYWGEVMASSFSRMDGEVSDGGGEAEYAEALKSMGSTAVVVMVGEEELVVANCGDSRAVLYRGGVALPLSCDHKSQASLAQPDRPDEKERVEAAGGRVINWNGCRVLGVLATSRSIGDGYLKPYVISEPEVIVCERTQSDEFIVIASDGLWDVVTNELACEVVRRSLKRHMKLRYSGEVSGSWAAEAAALLAELAMARGSRDNISVIVVELKRHSSSSS